MKNQVFFCLITMALGAVVITNNILEATVEKATFAGGCFWCMQPPFEKLDGVLDVTVGYANGHGENPTYHDYAQKKYIEAIQITYDPQKIAYTTLLDIFWRQIDPTDAGGQFVDRGPQYRSAILYHSDEQQKAAIASKDRLEHAGIFSKPIVTEIVKASTFYNAEEYHQHYDKKNPLRYKWYRYRSGRDQFLKNAWAKKVTNEKTEARPHQKPSDEELRKRLTPLQYSVTQKNYTEKPFANEYWDNKKSGIYVDIISGKPLFSSLDKYDSGTGWPSFTKPLEPENIVIKENKGWFSTRTEVRSKHSDAHLGHLFNDGPPPTGLRYCMNSAALDFIPIEDLDKKGYGQYKKLFEPKTAH